MPDSKPFKVNNQYEIDFMADQFRITQVNPETHLGFDMVVFSSDQIDILIKQLTELKSIYDSNIKEKNNGS